MKRKFLILTLCFTIIFSSINIKRSYADFVISPIMLATVSALAVGAGIALQGTDDIYDIGRLFVEYIHNNNSVMWETVNVAFESSVSFNKLTQQLTVGKSFGEIVKGFFDKTFGYVDKNSPYKDIIVNVGKTNGFPDFTGIFENYYADNKYQTFMNLPGIDIQKLSIGDVASYGDVYSIKKISDHSVDVYNGKGVKVFDITLRGGIPLYLTMYYYNNDLYYYCPYEYGSRIEKTGEMLNYNKKIKFTGDTVSVPYSPGTYNPGNVWNDNNVNDVPIYVPGNLGDLVGSSPGDIVGDKAPGWVGNGNVSIPNVDNPSIGIGGSTTFPNVSVENPPTDIPGVENPPVGVIPPFPSFGNSLDFSPMYLTNINEKFPFSLPWDIGRLIEKFDIEPKAPIFKVPIFTSEIELDLTIFDEWANIVRFFVLIGFVLSLILISTKLLG